MPPLAAAPETLRSVRTSPLARPPHHPRARWADDLRPHEVLLGRFRVEHVLGEGGSARVLAVKDMTTGEASAFKVLRALAPAVAAEAARRLANEARALARVGAPHVPRVLDAGLLPGGAPYLRLELVDGVDLDAYLALMGPLPWREAATYVALAAGAVAAAHARGVVHRDIKPSNLVLVQDSRGLRVVLIDFGIAKLRRRAPLDDAPVTLRDAADDPPPTRRGALLGTPSYMAPEQVTDPGGADEAADLFSLGATLYDLLVGEPLVPDASPASIARAALGAYTSALRARRPDVPEHVCQLVDRCIAPAPRARVGSAAVLRAALEAALAR